MGLPQLFRTTPFRLTLLFLALFGAAAAAFLAYIYLSTVGEVTQLADRGVAQEITRHGKTLDFQHESQRYCNYVKDKFGSSVGFIKPRNLTTLQDQIWTMGMTYAETYYFDMLKADAKPQIAADLLPRATASLLTCIGNFQAWRHFLLTRTTTQCHPKMLDVTNNDAISESGEILRNSLLDQFKATFPIIFDDIPHSGDFAKNMQMAR